MTSLEKIQLASRAQATLKARRIESARAIRERGKLVDQLQARLITQGDRAELSPDELAMLLNPGKGL